MFRRGLLGYLPANMIAKHKAKPDVVVLRPRGT